MLIILHSSIAHTCPNHLLRDVQPNGECVVQLCRNRLKLFGMIIHHNKVVMTTKKFEILQKKLSKIKRKTKNNKDYNI
jgi:hypothetical protein